jgi:hypothetical protein
MHAFPHGPLTSFLAFQCFLLLTKYQELSFVYDFWIKYLRKGVSLLGPDKTLLKSLGARYFYEKESVLERGSRNS